MKKIILISILLILIEVLLCGCRSSYSQKMRDTYPYITLKISSYYSDDIYIPLPSGYVFNPQYYYSEVKTEDGYDIVIHLKEPDE